MEEQVAVLEQKILSFGELLIGIDFNPSEDAEVNSSIDPRVHEVKKKMAEIANLMKESYTEDMRSPVKSLLFDHAIGEILSAQMAAVKLITFKA
jgi:hypothetical protein